MDEIAKIILNYGLYGGIAGLGLSLVLFIYREIIRKNIFPTLTKNHSYKLFNTIILAVAILAGLCIIAWTVISWYQIGIKNVTPNVSQTVQNTTMNEYSNVSSQTQNLDKSKHIKIFQKNKTIIPSNDAIDQKLNNQVTCEGFDNAVFNPYKITFDDENTPVCHDFPMIDVAKDTTDPKFSQSDNEYSSLRHFNDGDPLVVLLYIDNGAFNSFATDDGKSITPTPFPDQWVAKNVRIETTLENKNNIHIISAKFLSDNAKEIFGKVVIETKPDETVILLENTGFIYDYEGNIINDVQNLNLGNSSFYLGDLNPGFEYSLFLTYKLRVVKSI